MAENTEVSGSHLIVLARKTDEPLERFGRRLREASAQLARDGRASTVVVFVDDGEVGAPEQTSVPRLGFDGAILVTGLPAHDLPVGDACYQVSRRVIKEGQRGSGGERSDGFTMITSIVRAPFLNHDEFNAHWRDQHSKIHVAWSPGTCHYEQILINSSITSAPPPWDGLAFIRYATEADYTERGFDGAEGQAAILDDVSRFVDLSRVAVLPTSEFVFVDGLLAPTEVI